MSRFPWPARSEAYTTSLPSGESAGSVVKPESKVTGLRSAASAGLSGAFYPQEEDGNQRCHGSGERSYGQPPAPPVRRRSHGKRAGIGFLLEIGQCHLEVDHVVEATVGILPQATGNDPLKVAGNVGAGRRRVLVDHGSQRGDARVAAKCGAASDHFVENGAERKHIRARVDRLSLGLLGRHVCDGSDDRAVRRAWRRGLRECPVNIERAQPAWPARSPAL